LPHLAGEREPGAVDQIALALDEPPDFRTGGGPVVAEAHHAGRFVHLQVTPAFPALGGADRADYRRHRSRGALRLGETARDGVFEREQALLALALRDVLADAPVALERTVGIEHRLAADRDPVQAAVLGDTAQLQILEGLVRLHDSPVSGPVRFAHVGRGEFPAPLAD